MLTRNQTLSVLLRSVLIALWCVLCVLLTVIPNPALEVSIHAQALQLSQVSDLPDQDSNR